MTPVPAADPSQPTTTQAVVRGARVALALLLTINLFNYIDRYILAAVLPEIGRSMLPGDPNANQRLGWLATAFLLSYMLAAPVFGWLADRFSRWVLVGFGVVLWSIASGESGRADIFWVLLLTRAFVGIGEAAYGPAAPTIIADLFPVERRGRVMAWFYMAIPVGSALGYVWGGWWVTRGTWHLSGVSTAPGAASIFFPVLAHESAWRWAFYSVVIPGIVLGILCFFMPDPRKRAAGGAAAPRPSKARIADYLGLLRTPSYTLNSLAMAALTFAIGGISYWMPKYVADYRQATDLGTANTIFGAITVVTGITATLAGGFVGDWLRPRIRGAYFVISSIGLVVAFPALLLMLVTPFPYAWIWVAVAEFCLFFNTGPSNTALANVAPAGVRATAFATNILFIHALGDAISPPLIGAISDWWNLDAGFAAVGAVMLVGAVLWMVGARYLDRDTKRAEMV